MPMWARPPDSMTVFTSAKSRLMSRHGDEAVDALMPWRTRVGDAEGLSMVVPLVTT